jgi:hypothetical protein
MPRAALLSIHARVEGVAHDVLDDASLAQVWGPRYHVYVVAEPDLAVFTLGRLPDDGKIRQRADDLAARLGELLGDRRMRYDDAGQALGVHGNMLRYAALTGRFAIRWEGARRPTVWTVPPPTVEPAEATRELARRYLHVFGPATAEGFATWAGVGARKAARAFHDLGTELIAVVSRPRDGGTCWRATRRRCVSRRRRPQRRGSSRAATRTRSVSRATNARCSCRKPAGARSCGRRASGPARCSSAERSSARGGAQDA